MNERPMPNDLSPEEKRRLQEVKRRADQVSNDDVASIYIKTEAVDKLKGELGYIDDQDAYSITMRAKSITEDFFDEFRDENGESVFLDSIGEGLTGIYTGEVGMVNAALVGMAVVMGAFRESMNGNDFLNGVKGLSRDEIINTFDDFGQFPSERILTQRSEIRIPSLKTGSINNLVLWMASDFQLTDGTGEQFKDGAQLGYFLVTRNADIFANSQNNDSKTLNE